MKSDNWDYNKQQSDLLSRFWLVKYREMLEESIISINKMDFYEVKTVEEASKTITEFKERITRTNEILSKLEKQTDEELWINTITCVACLHSFKTKSELLDHLKIHLVKLGVFPDKGSQSQDSVK